MRNTQHTALSNHAKGQNTISSSEVDTLFNSIARDIK